MSIILSHYRTFFALLLALLLATGCSDQGSTPAPESESTEAAAPAEQATEAAEPAVEQAAEEAAPEASQAAAEPAAAEPAQTASAGGEKTYQTFCKACHLAGVANAPKLGDQAAWAPRIAKGNDALFTSVKKGLNAMPPKGTCMTCSDDDLRAAVEYMISQGS